MNLAYNLVYLFGPLGLFLLSLMCGVIGVMLITEKKRGY